MIEPEGTFVGAGRRATGGTIEHRDTHRIGVGNRSGRGVRYPPQHLVEGFPHSKYVAKAMLSPRRSHPAAPNDLVAHFHYSLVIALPSPHMLWSASGVAALAHLIVATRSPWSWAQRCTLRTRWRLLITRRCRGHTRGMRRNHAGAIAAAGVVLAAVAAACLVMPAARELGTLSGMWIAAAILGVPVLVILAVSGYPAYGGGRSLAVAVVITALTCAVSWVVAVFAFASALSGTISGVLMAIVLFGAPAASVLVFGFLARRLVTDRTAAGDVATPTTSEQP